MSVNILGFEEIAKKITSLFFQQKLHHAIILLGPKSIGKASFAKDLAITLLLANPKDSNASIGSSFIKDQQHPDLKIINSEGASNTIKINQIRGEDNDNSNSLIYFLNQTPAIASCKIAIIDAIDEANNNANNSLLKTLEEPLPNNFLILIAHNESKILPTIKSRCLIFKMPMISKDLFLKTILQKTTDKGLNLNDKDLDFIYLISNGAIGDAITNNQEYFKIYTQLINDLIAEKISNILLEKTSAKDFDLAILSRIINFLFTRIFLFYEHSRTLVQFQSYKQEILLFIKITNKQNLQRLFDNINKINNIFNETEKLYLDRKLAIINIFNILNR